MPNWTLKQLESFVWVAKLGSFRATAERLNTTQPNISVRISQLESVLDVRLFYRDSGSVALTPIGHSLLGRPSGFCRPRRNSRSNRSARTSRSASCGSASPS